MPTTPNPTVSEEDAETDREREREKKKEKEGGVHSRIHFQSTASPTETLRLVYQVIIQVRLIGLNSGKL